MTFFVLSGILHRVSKKRPTFDLLWSWHTWLSNDNFWLKHYPESRQSKCTLFSRLTYLCLCTTWGNRKPENCIFSLKRCILFTKNILKYHLVTAEPPFTVKAIDRMTQTGPRVLLSVTHMFCVNQVCHSVGRCVKDGSCSSSSLSESQRTVLIGYLTISTNVDAIKHITDDYFSFRKTAHWCSVRATQFNCCSTRLLQHLSEKCDFCVCPFYQVVQKHRLFEVAY